ncbi:MAG: hypothetical protein MZV63_71185 [Marinilabiliales bacterium]|nr:hypothetical protein [Marinilabiliales bacterium]
MGDDTILIHRAHHRHQLSIPSAELRDEATNQAETVRKGYFLLCSYCLIRSGRSDKVFRWVDASSLKKRE